MELRILGPVEMRIGGTVLDTGPPQQRHTLAALAVDAGQPVTTETLIDRVWDEAPSGARRTLQVHLTRIRRLLATAADGPPPRLLRRSGGYVLDIDADGVDLHRFRRLMRSAQAPGTAEPAALTQLREAMALWRGEPLTGLRGRWAAQARQAWRQQQLDAAVAWARAELLAGRPDAVIGPLGELAGQHPLAESLAAVLLRALCAAGRPAEALERYAAIRGLLAAELGTSPSAELQAVHLAILRGELEQPGSGIPTTARTFTVAAQLPPDGHRFAGRRAQLAHLDALLVDTADRTSTAAVIAVVSGPAGVGKTALAVHWAHTVADQFPDGQLYVNLRGFDPAGRIMEPADAVRSFLDALGGTPDGVPAMPDAQAARYRTMVAGKRILVVVDNARDAEQARPLLPGSPTAMTIVTSRDQLTGLVAIDGAHPMTLGVLSPAEAHDALTRRLGAHRTAAEPTAVRDIIAACAGLPLALTIAAARVQQSGFSLATLAAQLGDASQRLDALDAGDPASRVRTVFSWSFAALSPPAASLFRLLGMHPGPDISLAAAASLVAQPVPTTRRMLAELVQANLLAEVVPGRYTVHDLLRVYAGELVHQAEPAAARRAAIARLIDHYTFSACAAERLLNPARDPIALPLQRPVAGTLPEPLADHRAAWDWLTAERSVLLAVQRCAGDAGAHARAWQLAWALDTYLYRIGHWHHQTAAWQEALRAVREVHDVAAETEAHVRLAHAGTHFGRHAEARTHLLYALTLAARAGEPVTTAHIHFSLAYHWLRQDHPDRALAEVELALALYRAAGHRQGQAKALNAVGWCRAQLGDHAGALALCTLAVDLFRECDDRDGLANSWQSLGYAHHHLGRHAEAIDCYQHAAALYRDLGDCYNEADTHTQLGDIHSADGDVAAAYAAWQRAVELFTDIRHPAVRSVRARLASTRTAAAVPQVPAVPR